MSRLEIIRKITSRSSEFTIKESPMRGQTIYVLGLSVLVRISLVTVTPKNKKQKVVHLVEGLAVVKGRRFVRTDLTVDKLLRHLRKEIEIYFKGSK